MCGIALIFGYKTGAPAVDGEELLRIRDSMSRRGPDDAGLWINETAKVGLAHRRLSIIDPGKDGHQPMFTDCGRTGVVFNGEIYNYRELRVELEKKGYRFRTRSDTEVLLYAYEEYGQDMVHRLRGMFAFAVWDQQRRGVLLVRDHFGIKPLYYADDGKTIRAASQVKALLSGRCIDTRPDAAGYVGFYLWGHVPDPYTLYENIHALDAGTLLWVDENGVRDKIRYFSVAGQFNGDNVQPLSLTPADLRVGLAEQLRDSIDHHLISDVPLGIFLSSGLDSSTLVALASEDQQRRISSITLAFEEYKGTEHDEAPLAAAVAKHYGAEQHTVWTRKEDFASEFERFFAVMDQPSIDGLNAYFVSKAARGAGVKVALSGVGADELFGGYPGFTQIPKLVNGVKFMRSLPVLGKGFRWLSAPLLKHFTSPKYSGLLEYGHGYSGAYLLRRGLFMPWELPRIMDGDMVREGWRKLHTLVRLEETIDGINMPRSRISALELTWYMRNQLLRDADWAGMAHGLEIRTPFVDIELLKYLAPLINSDRPPSKFDMASTPAKPLLEQVLNKPKTGFSVPVAEWIQNGQRSRPMRGLRDWAGLIMDRGTQAV